MSKQKPCKVPDCPEGLRVGNHPEHDADFDKWTITIPIQGTVSYEILMPKGSNKHQAYKSVMENTATLTEDVSWEFEEDAQLGRVASAIGPGCEGEDVGDAAGEDEDEEVEEEE